MGRLPGPGRKVLPAEPREYDWPRLSPDGTRLVVTLPSDRRDIWIYDSTRQTLARCNFFDATDEDRPLWTPDGQRIVFVSSRLLMLWKRADGAGEAEALVTDPNPDRSPKSFSPDGKRLVFVQPNEGTRYDLHVFDVRGRSSKPLLQTPFSEDSPAVSPDGRWLAYRSDETGRYEVYVRPFPDVDTGKWQISTEGGNAPLWAPNGRQLFYQSGDALIAVAAAAGASFAAGIPQILFRRPSIARNAGTRNYDISRDGRRFIMVKDDMSTLEASARDELTVVLNWFDELRKLSATGQ